MPNSLPRRLAIALATTMLIAPIATPALAFTPVSELKDLSPDHWAYASIQALVEKYEVMEGFPDKTFRGPKTLTRYELAAALARVMAKVEELISSATGQPINVEPGVNPEDLRTIARLQREFRDELEVLKGRVDSIDTRVQTIEKRVRFSGEVRNEYRDFLGGTAQGTAPLAELRVRNRLNMDAGLADELTTHGALYWDVYGAKAMGNAFATEGEGPACGAAWQNIYAAQAYGSYRPSWGGVHIGMVNASDVITLGSTLKNPFTTNVWREGLGGYGFVGTPGMNVDGGPTVARMGTAGAPGANTNAVWWLPGTDVVTQALDPNATQPLSPHTNFTVAATGEAGPFSGSVAVYQPGAGGRSLDRLKNLAYPTGLPQAEVYGNGQRMVATAGADFGMVRAQLAAKSPGLLIDNMDRLDKTVTGTVDVGSDAMGLSLQAVTRTAFTGQFVPQQASLTLASNDLFGTGFGLGLGANSGVLIDSGFGLQNTFRQAATPNSLMQGLSGTDYTSYGLYLRLPGFTFMPSFTIAAQQTAGADLKGILGSGITLQGDFQILALPKLQVEYSQGKFDPGVDNGLLNNAAYISHEQLTCQMVLPF